MDAIFLKSRPFELSGYSSVRDSRSRSQNPRPYPPAQHNKRCSLQISGYPLAPTAANFGPYIVSMGSQPLHIRISPCNHADEIDRVAETKWSQPTHIRISPCKKIIVGQKYQVKSHLASRVYESGISSTVRASTPRRCKHSPQLPDLGVAEYHRAARFGPPPEKQATDQRDAGMDQQIEESGRRWLDLPNVTQLERNAGRMLPPVDPTALLRPVPF